MQTLSKSYFQALNCKLLPPVELRDAWSNEIFQEQHEQYYRNIAAKDRPFLSQILQLFQLTENLKIS
jgi:hypothetical protein